MNEASNFSSAKMRFGDWMGESRGEKRNSHGLFFIWSTNEYDRCAIIIKSIKIIEFKLSYSFRSFVCLLRRL